MSASKDEGKSSAEEASSQSVSEKTPAPAQTPVPANTSQLAYGHTLLDGRRKAVLAETLADEQPLSARSVRQPISDKHALGETLPPESFIDDKMGQTLPPDGEVAVSISLTEESLVSLQQEFPVQRWERYEFLQLLGQGGMGAVYKARDKRLGRIVALKFIRGSDPNMIMRFLQEARAQARIDHPNVCKVHEVGEVEGKAYIAMQYVDGKALESAAASLSLPEKVFVMRQVTEAMHHAHRLGIVHRDLKPANVMLERAENGSLCPVVMDFGLARESSENRGLTESGAVLGTPAYMAPEQARGDTRAIDRRSDVYSLGATLYDLICGVPPFDATNIVDILIQVVNDDPVPLRTRMPSVPPDLETIVMKCLNKEPNRRYDSAKALSDDLQHYLNGEPIVGKRLSLVTRMQLRARKQRALFAVSALSLLVVIGLGLSGLRQYVANQRERQRLEIQARTEREIAQHLGQEITKMEWVLRSARQLPLHDLSREKVIVRERMVQLQSQLKSYGELSRGLGHYALGRGHMALHEYPQALAELREAMRYGVKSADFQYALGFVLGKHFEQAMYEARLSGGGDWAKKQLKEIEPKYLAPAIDSLQRSRAVKLDSPKYLEGLIAYYQRDYDSALQNAAAAIVAEPWLYEAHRLAGDVHFERALQARDSGKYPEAEKEFVGAVKSYEAAAAIGQSDGEVYEGLAEAWVRQIEMAMQRGQKAEEAYAAAVSASDRISATEPQSINGPLKKAFASMMTMVITGGGPTSEERAKQCLAEADAVLRMAPGHPYASEVAAGCNAFAANGALAKGEDPEPYWGKALALLEPAVKRTPHFLWGLNDLGNLHQNRGSYAALHGDPSARELLEKALKTFSEATDLDQTYLNALLNVLSSLDDIVLVSRSKVDIQDFAKRVDDWFSRCQSVNNNAQQCYNNYAIFYTRAAKLLLMAGEDPQPYLARAKQKFEELKRLGGSYQDAEQHTALAHYVDASDRVRRKEDPTSALIELQAAIARCLKLTNEDAMCRTLAAQGEQVAADWLALQKKPFRPVLEIALGKATLATRSPEKYPEAWLSLASIHLRLANTAAIRAKDREQHITEGLNAVAGALAINPNHAIGHAIKGALMLLHAQAQSDPAARHASAQSALTILEDSLKRDPFRTHDYIPWLTIGQQLL